MKEEDTILRKVGTDNPFRVPEGYFEQFSESLMERLPKQATLVPEATKEPTLWDKVKPWVYMAAMFAGAALIIRTASGGRVDDVADSEVQEMELISEAVDYSMLDDYSLYVYLTDAE